VGDDPASAEVAVAVVDPWQGRGVATELLRRLAERASQEGIERFTATCLARNHEVIQLLHELGAATDRPAGAGVLEVRVDLPARLEPEDPLSHTLRAAARGDLNP
jgi:GNAT superfamily N-acetyltransferase